MLIVFYWKILPLFFTMRLKSGSLWNYYRDEPNSTIGDNNITHSILNSESFDYKASFMENGVTHDN